MASHLPSIRKIGKYKSWMLNLQSNRDITLVKFSSCASLVGLASQKSVIVLQLDYCDFSNKEIAIYHSDFEIENIEWSPDSEALLIISLQFNQLVVIQHIQDPVKKSIFRVQDPTCVSLIFAGWLSDSKHLISVSAYNIYSYIHSPQNGTRFLLPSISCTKSGKPLMSSSHDGKYFVSAYYKNTSLHIAVISTLSWMILWCRKIKLLTLNGLEWSSNSDMLALWDDSKNATFFELNGDKIKTLHYEDLSVTGFSYATFSKDLFAATCCQNEDAHQKNLILLYNLNTWQLSVILEQELSPLCLNPYLHQCHIAFSQCGNFLASSMTNGIVKIWNTRDSCNPMALLKLRNCLAGLQWHPNKAKLAVSTQDGIAIFWTYPEDGPVTRQPKISSVPITISYPCSIIWSKRIVIFSSMEHSQGAVILVKNKRRKKH